MVQAMLRFLRLSTSKSALDLTPNAPNCSCHADLASADFASGAFVCAGSAVATAVAGAEAFDSAALTASLFADGVVLACGAVLATCSVLACSI